MNMKPFASYSIIKPNFDKVRLFSQNIIFQLFHQKKAFMFKHINVSCSH